MSLADRVAQYREAITVREPATGRTLELEGAAGCAARVARCPLRFVLHDDLTRLCAELAFSRGARELACADLLHVPAERLWVEWCHAPWQRALGQFGIATDASPHGGRRGALIHSSADGRRGTVRTLWTFGEQEVLASSMEAYFDFDTPAGDEPRPPDGEPRAGFQVRDGQRRREDVLARCFRFRYERSWAEYYAAAALAPLEREALLRHVLGTVAIAMPLLLAFFLLLASRAGLPRRARGFERLNVLRARQGRLPLLDHIEVCAPLLPEYLPGGRAGDCEGARRSPRLHHVRGHLVRHGSQLFWRVPHLRGSARQGAVRTRTVTLSFDEPRRAQGLSHDGAAASA
jgi:hypothetical protein